MRLELKIGDKVKVLKSDSIKFQKIGTVKDFPTDNKAWVTFDVEEEEYGFDLKDLEIWIDNSIGAAIKYDAEKIDFSHISLTLMEEVSKVRMFGAKKYSRGNWKKGFKFTRSIAAALRHIHAFNNGQDFDPESGELHISHAVCCLEHLLNDIKNHPENDDR